MSEHKLVESGFDFEAAENKIKELQTMKTALSYEISKNQANAEELRNRLKFLEEKIEEHKTLKASVLREVESKIAESEKLNSELRKLRIQYDQQKNDIETEKRSLDSIRTTLSLEKASMHERNELKEEQLAKREAAVIRLEKEIGYKLNEADTRLSLLAQREEKLTTQGEYVSRTISETELAKKEAVSLKNEAQKMMDEAQSVKKIADEKVTDLNKFQEDLIQREHSLRTDLEYFEASKKKLKQDEREISQEKNKIMLLRQRLQNEIDNAGIESKIKDEIKSELEHE